MTIYQPYFYVIQDVRNGMYYAGAKWGKSANPDNFMIEGGYITSSNTIKELISQHGLYNFIVRKIRIFDTAEQAQDYETRFLRKVDARANLKFYNGHNNDGNLDPRKMKIIMLELYGVENCSGLNWVKNKKSITCLKNFGVKWPMQSIDIQTKMKNSNYRKYGNEYIFQVDMFKDKIMQTNLEKYGVEWPMMSNKVKETMKNNNLEKYGVGNVFQADEVKEKIKITKQEKYGDSGYNNKEKAIVTNKEKYGGNAPACSEEVINKMKKTCIERYGVENYSKSEEGRIFNSNTKINKRKREIVNLILNNTTKYYRSQLGLGKGWYQKDDEYLLEIYENIVKTLQE